MQKITKNYLYLTVIISSFASFAYGSELPEYVSPTGGGLYTCCLPLDPINTGGSIARTEPILLSPPIEPEKPHGPIPE